MERKSPKVGTRRIESNVEAQTLTITEAVSYSRLSRSFLYKKFDTGELPRLKAGKRVLVFKHDMDAFLESLRERSNAR